jgi:hypothetical protein
VHEISTVLGGIGLLIAGYLVVTNAPGVAKVAEAFAASGIDTVLALQGRGTGYALAA